MNREDFLESFDFTGYVISRFSPIMETSNEDRIVTICPMCDDTTGHLYILLSAGLAYCQKCKYDPKSPIKFISDTEGISQTEVIRMSGDNMSLMSASVSDIVDSLFESPVKDEFEYEVVSFGSTYIPVLETINIFPIDSALNKAKEYLRDRGVSDKQILDYSITYCYDGQYAGRIIVPCFYNGDAVTFVARDIFGTSSRKYLNPKGNKQNDFLYNWDNIDTDTVVVTEGVFDAIAASEVSPAVATFGKSLSARQIEMLNTFKRVVFYWDVDAYPQVERYSESIRGECVAVLHSDGKDAGSRTIDENSVVMSRQAVVGSVAYEMFKLLEVNG